MNKLNPNSRGTTLVELLVAIGLFAMAIAALMAINNMAFQGQGGAMAQTAAANNASMIANAFSKATASASYIQCPTSNPNITCPGTINSAPAIVVWDDVQDDGSNNLSPIDGVAQNVIIHYLCVDNAGSNAYLYQGSLALSPLPTFTCDGSKQNGLTPTLIAGAVTGMTITPAFSRPANNVVKSSYTVTFVSNGQSIYITQTTQAMLQGPLN